MSSVARNPILRKFIEDCKRHYSVRMWQNRPATEARREVYTSLFFRHKSTSLIHNSKRIAAILSAYEEQARDMILDKAGLDREW